METGWKLLSSVHLHQQLNHHGLRTIAEKDEEQDESDAVTQGYYVGCTRVYVMNSFHLCHLIKLKFHICIQHFKLE